MFVTGIVLAAGASRRLGRPKQLLPYRDSTLLASTLLMVRQCGFGQLLVTVGGAVAEVRKRVDLTGFEVVENPAFDSGCGSSVSAAIGSVDSRAGGVVLLLGDQPGVSPATVASLLEATCAAPTSTAQIGICRYLDGLGHPFWFDREQFGELAVLHGDKAVWKLLHSQRFGVVEVAVDAPIPIDVDTWDDYQTLISADPASR